MRGFKLASLNVTSIIKHIDELRVLLVDHSIDVLAINETRLDSTINDNVATEASMADLGVVYVFMFDAISIFYHVSICQLIN